MIKLNFDKLVNYILIAVGVLYLTHCGGSKEVAVIPDGYISPKEFDYRIQVIDLLKTNQNLEHEIQTFKNKYEKDTSIIIDAGKRELIDMVTDRYRERER